MKSQVEKLSGEELARLTAKAKERMKSFNLEALETIEFESEEDKYIFLDLVFRKIYHPTMILERHFSMIPRDLIFRFLNKFDWNAIFRHGYYHPDEKILDSVLKLPKIETELIKQELSLDFIERHADELNFKGILAKNQLPLDMLTKYKSKLFWPYVLKQQSITEEWAYENYKDIPKAQFFKRFTASREFIDKHHKSIPEAGWKVLSRQAKRLGGRDFLETYKNVLNWGSVSATYPFTEDEFIDFYEKIQMNLYLGNNPNCDYWNFSDSAKLLVEMSKH